MELRFLGQWFEAESGLHQNWMRDYDPTTGRYIQADPLGLVDGSSVYGYAMQSPNRYIDPRGLMVAGPSSQASLSSGVVHCSAEDCDLDHEDEIQNCYARHRAAIIADLSGCLARAGERFLQCNCGVARGERVPEWSDADEDVPRFNMTRVPMIIIPRLSGKNPRQHPGFIYGIPKLTNFEP